MKKACPGKYVHRVKLEKPAERQNLLTELCTNVLHFKYERQEVSSSNIHVNAQMFWKQVNSNNVSTILSYFFLTLDEGERHENDFFDFKGTGRWCEIDDSYFQVFFHSEVLIAAE